MKENKQEHFIKNIEIKNFKCFENFKAEGFGRINLIGGKNNVGKTAFMEACYLTREENNTVGKTFSSLVQISNIRNGKIEEEKFDNIFNLLPKNHFLIKSNTGLINFDLIFEYTENKLKYFGKFISIQGIKFSEINYPTIDNKFETIFIASDKIEDKVLEFIFDKIKKQRKREKLNKILNKFDKNILEFDIIEDKPQVFLKNIQDFQNVLELGHGLKRYIAIIGAILINKDGMLFLDEIENGIHYTNLDKLWEIILTISKQQNVQVFATTHSKECIESYARVVKKLGDEEIRFIELGRNKNNELDSIVMNSEMFLRFIKLGNEVRGW